MAGFTYRLQAVLDQKVDRKQSAQQALAEKQREVAGEERALEDCIRESQAAAGKLSRSRREMFDPGQPAGGRAVQMRRDYVRRMEAEAAAATDAVRLQENRVQEARERVKRAQRVLTEAAREVEILERHKQRLESRFRREQDRKEAVEHDDAGSIIHLRRRQQV